MAFELPAPRSSADIITEANRRRIEILAQPTFEERIAPQVFGAAIQAATNPQQIPVGFGQGNGGGNRARQLAETSLLEDFAKRKEKEKKDNFGLVSKFLSLPQDQRELPQNREVVTKAMLELGLNELPDLRQPEERMKSIERISAETQARAQAAALARNEANRESPVQVINPITGEIADTPRGSRFVTPPGASEAAKMIDKIKGLRSISEIQKLKAENLPKGRIFGRGAIAINKLTGQFPEVGAFQSIYEATLPVYSRIIGGDVGNLAEQEQQRAAKINPNLIQTKEEMVELIDFVQDVLKAREKQAEKRLSGGFFSQQAPSEQAARIDPETAAAMARLGITAPKTSPAPQNRGPVRPLSQRRADAARGLGL